MKLNIALIPGDGIGPEIIAETRKVLCRIAEKYHHQIQFSTLDMGGCAIDRYGVPMPDDTLRQCLAADSVLLGAVGGPKWNTQPGHLRPEAALLQLRKEMQVYANLRPVKSWTQLADASPLKNEITRNCIDLMIVRELTGGIYFGRHSTDIIDGVATATDILTYDENEIRRIAETAFNTARRRSGKVCSVDKCNVLDSSRLWHRIMEESALRHPDVQLTHMLVDNCAMQLIRDPAQFDVIVTENMFGDILSDEASMLTGSIGMLPSASLGDSGKGLYEPAHGSAPDIAGTDTANPIAAILAAAMMLRLSFNLETEAANIENAVEQFLESGARTADIMPKAIPQHKMHAVTCSQCGKLITEKI